MRYLLCYLGSLVGILCLLSGSAHADGAKDPKKAEAAHRFDRGLALFEDGDNAGALAEFQRTYELFPNPVVLYNIGLVYAAMRRPVEAVEALQKAVKDPGLPAKMKGRAQETLTDQMARIGRVMVVTKPEGARIEVDNVEVGKTPLAAPLRVSEGSHMVGAVAEGFSPARKEVLVAGNADASVSLELVSSEGKKLANLALRSKVPGAEVRVDGEPAGKTPLVNTLTLVAGRHHVELRRPGYKTAERDVDVGAGATGELVLDPEVDQAALGSQGAPLLLDITEPGAVVFVDDKSMGPYRSSLRVPKGLHHLRVERGGFFPFEREVDVESGGKPIRIELEPTAEKRASYESSANFHRTWGWIGIIGGAVIAGAGAGYLTLVTGPKDDLAAADKALTLAENDARNDTGICDTSSGAVTPDECQLALDGIKANYDDAYSRKQTHDILGFTGIGVGAAVLVTGVILLVTGDDPSRYDHAPSRDLGKSKPGPRVATAPGPGQIGLGLAVTF